MVQQQAGDKATWLQRENSNLRGSVSREAVYKWSFIFRWVYPAYFTLAKLFRKFKNKKKAKHPTTPNLQHPEVLFTKTHAILSSMATKRFIFHSHRQQLHTPTSLPALYFPALPPSPHPFQSFVCLGSPRHWCCVSHLWQGCGFPKSTSTSVCTLRPPACAWPCWSTELLSQRQPSVADGAFCLGAVLSYWTRFPQEIIQRNLFICSYLWVGGLYHMHIPVLVTSLILSCPSLPTLRQNSFHTVRRTKRSFLLSRNCIWSFLFLFLSGNYLEMKNLYLHAIWDNIWAS